MIDESVEPNAVRGTTRKSKASSASPFRQQHRQQVLCYVDPLEIALAAGAIHLRLYELDRSRGVGGYVFVDPETFEVYVMPEDKPALHSVLRSIHTNGWHRKLLGHYCTTHYQGLKRGKPADMVLRASVADLVDDLTEHLGVAHG